MDLQTATIENFCPRSDIAAYIDGELRADEELAFEFHIATCPECAEELNEQKKLLCVLDSALEDEKEIELPVDFTRVVVTNAESKVNGLRHPRERFSALFVCASLFFLAVLGFGSETETVLDTFVKFGERVFAVAIFSAHLISNIALGSFVVLRSLSYQFVYNSTSLAFLITVFFVSLLALSGLIVRFNRL